MLKITKSNSNIKMSAPPRTSKVTRTFKWALPLVFALAASSNAAANDLYLVIGQSNAAGRDTNIESSGADAPDSNVRLFTSWNSFEVASQPLNRHSNVRNTNQDQGVNFGLEFGKEMFEHNGRRVHLVVNARGGTRVAEWRERNDLFGPTVQRVKDAEDVCNCSLTGILWHQGEGNISCLLYTSPSPRDQRGSRMPSSA